MSQQAIKEIYDLMLNEFVVLRAYKTLLDGYFYYLYNNKVVCDRVYNKIRQVVQKYG